MAQLKEIFERESQRGTAESCTVIHLFQEGTFYRAYEWSAWLCVRYINGFKVTKRELKSQEETMVLVGFPVTSLQKYTPQDAEVSFNDDKSVSIRLPQSLLEESGGAETMAEEFANWKRSVPVQEAGRKKGEYTAVDGQPGVLRLTDILHEVLVYPVEQKTPMECMNFIAAMKQKISAII